MASPGGGVMATLPTVVVGAGVIGLATAFELQKRGRQVVVIDAADGVAASRAAGGMLAPTCESEVARDCVVRLGFESLSRYGSFVAELENLTGIDCRLNRQGTLWLAAHRDDEGELEHLRHTFEAKGLSCEMLTSAEVAEAEPHVTPRLLCGLRVHGDHQVDPRLLLAALREAVTRGGGRFRMGERAVHLEQRGEVVCGLRVAREDRTELVACDELVIATGASSSRWASPWPAAASVRPVKGQAILLRGAPLVRHVLRSPRVYLIPRGDGYLYLGATVEERGFDTSNTAGDIMELLHHATRLVPAVQDLQWVECMAGLRPATADHIPLIGPGFVKGTYLATGHYRDGILLAAATAHHLAEGIVSGVMPKALRPFDKARFLQ